MLKPTGYTLIWDHYADELRLLDMKLQLIYLRRQTVTPDPQTDAFRGMFVSEDEFMRLVAQSEDESWSTPEAQVLLDEIKQLENLIRQHLARSKEQGIFMPLPYVSACFGLSPLEERMVMLGLAIELDRKYERIFGFLVDDLTCKAPNVSLALQVNCSSPEDMRAARTLFHMNGKLSRYFLQREDTEYQGKSLLSKTLVLQRRMVVFLLDSGKLDGSLKTAVQIVYPDEVLESLKINDDVQQQMQAFAQNANKAPSRGKEPVSFYIWGHPGAGKRLQVKHCCRSLRQTLLIIDIQELLADGKPFIQLVEDVLREAILHQAAVCFTHLEDLLPEEPDAASDQRLHLFYRCLETYEGILFLVADRHHKLSWKPKARVMIEIELVIPDEGQREILWESFAEELAVKVEVDWRTLSGKFRFTPGQIRRALWLARGYSGWKRDFVESGSESSVNKLQMDALYKACYQQVQHKLERRATKIEPKYGWEDVVLPAEQKDQLRYACNQVKYRSVVYNDWGFEKKLAYGKGLSMLFAGPPGTGKTMSAQVVAKELQLELFKIDLSQVISKYIGETEKNLHEIFTEAQLSNAVLFFDETDALFGKRSEVKDSHDKYANIETAYLLQKMEEYQGISVLATNLLNNIDEAFLRRINYIIKFPFPDADYREKIWKSLFPSAAPVSEEVDFRYLAQKYEIAGGNIKNVVISAAFRAAESGEAIGMRHILGSIRHELQKSGKIIPKQDMEDF